jgi:hypothetical protein
MLMQLLPLDTRAQFHEIQALLDHLIYYTTVVLLSETGYPATLAV